MAGRLSASILVRLVDQASGPAGKIAKALKGVGSLAKSLGGSKAGLKVDGNSANNLRKIATEAKRAGASLKALEKSNVRISSSDLRSFRAASTAARRLTSDLKDAASAAKSIRVNLNGSGFRSSPFASMRRDIQGALKDMQRLQAAAAKVGRGRGGFGGGAGGVGSGGAVYHGRGRRGHGVAEGYVAVRAAEAAVRGSGRAAKFVGKAGANSMREDARDYLAGLKPEDTERLHKVAVAKSAEYNSVDATTLHEMLRDTSMSMGSVDKGVENSDNLARMAVVMQSMKGPEKAIENVRQFYSALDVLGKNVDPATVKKLANAYTKATGVEGAEMDMGKLLQVAKQSRNAGGSLSDDFLMYAVPSLMQDLGAPQVGTALATGLSQVIGGRATKESKYVQSAFGLRDNSLNMKDKDALKFMSDPDKYAYENIMPALAKGAQIPIRDKRGKVVGNENIAPIDFNSPDQEDTERRVNSALMKMFSQRTVSDIFGKLINQRAQYARKRQQYDAAPGTDAAPVLPGKDPYVAGKAVVSQATNVAAEAVRPFMQPATDALNTAASALGSLAKSMADNPAESKIATPMIAGVVGAVSAWLAGTGLTALAGNSPGLAAGAARLAGGALTGGAGALAGAPLVAGVVGGAALDEGIGSIGGKDTLESWNKSLERRKSADFADAVLKSTAGVGAFDRNKKMGTVGSAADGYSSDFTESRGVVGDFLFGKKKGSVQLPGFGFQTAPAPPQALPGAQTPFIPPRRPAELGGTEAPAPAPLAAGTGLPVATPQVEKISAATAEVAKFEAELAKAKAQLDGLRASGEGAFSPEAFNMESKVSELESAVAKAKARLEELNTVNLTGVDAAVDTTKGKLDQLGSTSVTPKVDPSSIQGAVSAVDALLSKLAQVGPAAAAGAAAVQRSAAAAGVAASQAGRAVASLERSRQTATTSSPA
jgi:hypothetical protein